MAPHDAMRYERWIAVDMVGCPRMWVRAWSDDEALDIFTDWASGKIPADDERVRFNLPGGLDDPLTPKQN